MKNYTIATLGSHTALQILKGAKDEGFQTLCIATRDRTSLYQRFGFIDTIFPVSDYSDIFHYEKTLIQQQAILIPHGSFIAYLGIQGNKKITIPYFGNKKVLDWETDRNKQTQWLHEAKIRTPRVYAHSNQIDRTVIVKSFGAAGGSGYFVVQSEKEFEEHIRRRDVKKYIIQEYIVGVPMYFHYFYSPLHKTLELLSIDRRYESNADALGRIPFYIQQQENIPPSFVVVGNSPLSVRESLLPEIYAMGERLVVTSKKLINAKGIYGPFCLETIVTPDQKIYVIEVSCRIVAGTNLFIHGSPYADLLYDEPMSTGRRIAREIKEASYEDNMKAILN